ncbi:hypothetical protein [Kibdelosporangium philippinense]|uniref:hypothetical protein n=1 Tax=Kibdelosporangium philippinense TaxID=211113 RepID=UPI003617FD7D
MDTSERPHAGQVELAWLGFLVPGQQHRRDQQDQHYHRDGDDEHRAPPEAFAAYLPVADARHCFQVGPARRGAGPMPAELRISHTVDAAI